jgi:hypothetical protein
MNTYETASNALNQGDGILRLIPAWVPRYFCTPGRRIKLHPHDYFAYGGERGGIDERWLSSTTPADNGPLTSENEGMSFIVSDNGKTKMLLKDAVNELKGELIGNRLWDKYNEWPVYTKFFDNQDALPFHIHQRDEHARLTGQMGKPESYYFPPQLNNHGGNFPFTFFGIIPKTPKEEVVNYLKKFNNGDNGITNISQAYRLEPGTGWDVPSGVLHAPGSLCTYEPQKASDVFAMYESKSGNMVLPQDLLWKDSPEEKKEDYNHLLEQIDWELNTDPDFKKNRFLKPLPVKPEEEMKERGYTEYWISYKSTDFSAKELTLFPGNSVIIKDKGSYGVIIMQGHGKMGIWDIETPALIRFGQLTNDEFFVCEKTALDGVKITNHSSTDNLVMLKLFGPGNPELELNF